MSCGSLLDALRQLYLVIEPCLRAPALSEQLLPRGRLEQEFLPVDFVREEISRWRNARAVAGSEVAALVVED
jgi:hypothetical protein